MSQPEPRIGDREREAAVAALGEHYVAGRLTKEEFDERTGVAWQARTSSDLAPLFYDLPALQAPRPSKTPAPWPTPGPRPGEGRSRRQFGPPVLPILLLVLVLTFAMGLKPWPLLILVLVFFWVKVASGRGSRRR